MVNQEDRKTFDTYAQFTLWYSGCTPLINTYFKIYTEYKSLYPGGNTEVKGIGGLIKPQGIETIILGLEDNTDKIHNLNLENVYYFPDAPNLLISPQKQSQGRGQYKFDR